MPDPNQRTDTAQFLSLLRSFAFDPGLIADHLLGEEHLARVIDQEIPRTCARIFTPLITLATFLAQNLSDDHSCQAALDRLLAWRAARGLPPANRGSGGMRSEGVSQPLPGQRLAEPGRGSGPGNRGIRESFHLEIPLGHDGIGGRGPAGPR